MGGPPLRIPIFPLAGALLFPRAQLPLHIFEPRYVAMVRDALATHQTIGMVQPRPGAGPNDLFETGCLGRIVSAEELELARELLTDAPLPSSEITLPQPPPVSSQKPVCRPGSR